MLLGAVPCQTPPVSASDVTTQLLRTRVAPALRELGLRGSGQHFRLVDDGGHHALLSVVRSQAMVPGESVFTVEVAFHEGGQAWQAARAAAAWLPERPTASRLVVPSAWHERLGFLAEPPHDHWFLVQGPDDADPVADELITLVRDVALPQLTARVRGEVPPPVPVLPRDPGPDGAERPRVACPSAYCTLNVYAARHGW